LKQDTGIGYRMQETGYRYRIQDARNWIQGTKYAHDAGCRMQDAGYSYMTW